MGCSGRDSEPFSAPAGKEDKHEKNDICISFL